MSRIFDVVQSLVGQRNCLVIPRQFLQFFTGDQQAYQLAAVLNQIIFWSGCSTREDGWFYKTHEELGEEVALSADQVRRVVDKLTRFYLPGILESQCKRTGNGDKVKHYRLDGEQLICKLFAEAKNNPKPPDGNGEAAEPETQHRHSEVAKLPALGNGEVATPILYTDPNTDPDIQISCPVAMPPDESDDPAKEVLNHFNLVTGHNYRDRKTTMGFIRGRLSEDYVATDLILITDYLTAKWLNDSKMNDYLRPKTIFGPENCADYFEKAKAWERSGRPTYVNGAWVKSGGSRRVTTATADIPAGFMGPAEYLAQKPGGPRDAGDR